jgi:hypothetical protein
MAIARDIDLTWRGDVRPFTPTIQSIVKIENVVRKATERPDFSIADVMLRLDRDPVVFAAVWGTMLHIAGHDRDAGVKDADAVEWWYQQAWIAITNAAVDPVAIADLTSARDVIVKMVAPSVDLGKQAAPREIAASGGARKKAAQTR